MRGPTNFRLLQAPLAYTQDYERVEGNLSDYLQCLSPFIALSYSKIRTPSKLSVVFISLVENGRREISLQALRRMAKVLNVRLEDLVRGVK